MNISKLHTEHLRIFHNIKNLGWIFKILCIKIWREKASNDLEEKKDGEEITGEKEGEITGEKEGKKIDANVWVIVMQFECHFLWWYIRWKIIFLVNW